MMEHLYTRVLSRKIKLVIASLAIAPSILMAAQSDKELQGDILLKQALISLFEKNKALEERIALLEKNVFPNKDMAKGKAQNPYTFFDLVKENIAKKKFTYGKATKTVIVRKQPDTKAQKVTTVPVGGKVIVKGLVRSKAGSYWYKLDEGAYVYIQNITFWSDKK